MPWFGYSLVNVRFLTHKNNVQEILVIVFEFTGSARGFMINFLRGPQSQTGWTALV